MTEKERLIEHGWLAVKRCRHGPMLYSKHDSFIGRSLDLYGEWAEAEMKLFRQIVKLGDVVIDVGASIGTHTVFLAKEIGPRGHVIAFEPQRFSFQMLCGNVSLNQCLNVRCFHAAVGSTPGWIQVPILNPQVEQNFGALRIRDHSEGEQVEVRTLAGQRQVCKLER